MSARHAQVARDLIEAIGSGRFPVGSHLPTELELAESYGASRNTIRSALQELQDLGLISRRRRAGTRVEAVSPTIGYRYGVASIETLMQFGAEHSREVMSAELVTAGRALARILGCSPGTSWLHIASLRRTAERDEPIGRTDSYLDLSHAELLGEIEGAPTLLISAIVEARHGRRIAEIRQEVDATIIDAAMAQSLRCEAGSAGLRLVRRYVDPSGVTFLVTVSLHPAGRFTVSTTLRRRTEGPGDRD